MNHFLLDFWKPYLEHSDLFCYELTSTLRLFCPSSFQENYDHIIKEFCNAFNSIGEQCLYHQFSKYLSSSRSLDVSFADFCVEYNVFDLLSDYPALEDIFNIRLTGGIHCITNSLQFFSDNLFVFKNYYNFNCIECVTIFPFLSDPHLGGSQVIRFDINSKFSCFYKPKSIQFDIYFLELFDFVAKQISYVPESFSKNIILNDKDQNYSSFGSKIFFN
mgnify:CR=1 FL=1